MKEFTFSGMKLIMKVINLKKQANNSRFNSLVSFTRPHEKP